MKYKVGDRVRIVKNRTNNMNVSGYMDKYLGTVMTISGISESIESLCPYRMVEDYGTWTWNDEMIEGLVSDEMSAVELLEWLDKHYLVFSDMLEAFDDDYSMRELLEHFSPREIISKIQKFERDHLPKKMTVAEIEERLGYKIEIVKEDMVY